MSVTLRHIAGAPCPPAGAYDADIIILAMDRADETVAAIGSALAQMDVSRHVLVLDQGSTPDNLARLAGAIADRADATLLRSDVNLGVPGGRNAATGFGHGRAILALDNDAEFATATIVAEAVQALDGDSSLAAIGLRVVLFSDGADDLSSWGYPQQLLGRAAGSFEAVTFVGAGHAISRAAWDAAGGYDPGLFFCWEEFDFCLRAIADGRRVRYRGDLVVRHKVSAERRVAWTGRRWFHFVRNRLWIERKWGAGWVALAPRIFGYAIKGLRHGLAWQTLRAIAIGMGARVATREMPAAGRAYLATHDRAHRGSLLDRMRFEVFARLPGKARRLAP